MVRTTLVAFVALTALVAAPAALAQPQVEVFVAALTDPLPETDTGTCEFNRLGYEKSTGTSVGPMVWGLGGYDRYAYFDDGLTTPIAGTERLLWPGRWHTLPPPPTTGGTRGPSSYKVVQVRLKQGASGEWSPPAVGYGAGACAGKTRIRRNMSSDVNGDGNRNGLDTQHLQNCLMYLADCVEW